MAVQKIKEQLNGKYDGVIPATLLKPGSIADGLNMRKVSAGGGWKSRKGCTLLNTTAFQSGADIDSLHHYKNPRSSDYHFIVQTNGKLIDCTNDPPATGSATGTDLGVTISSTTPGFSDVVKEDLFYADGSSRPIAYGGDTPYCTGCMVWDNSQNAFVDYTRKVTDGRTDTYAYLGDSSNDEFYVCSSEIADGVAFVVSSANAQTVTMTVYSWQSGAWAAVSSMSDGTLSGGCTLAQSGTISWTRDSSDEMKVIGGIMGYWYKFVPSASVYHGTGSYVSSLAGTQLLNEACGAATLGDWDDDDTGDGASTQTTFDSLECFKFDAGSAGSANAAQRSQDIGTMTNRAVVSIKLYHDLIGTHADDDAFCLVVPRSNVKLLARFCSDGLYVYDGAAHNEVGTNLVEQDTWQEWTFDLRWWDDARAVCDVYLNDEQVATNVDCSYTGAYTDGDVVMYQHGDATADCITYVDYLKISPEFAVETLESNADEVEETFDIQSGSGLGWRENWRGSGKGSVTYQSTQSRDVVTLDSEEVDGGGGSVVDIGANFNAGSLSGGVTGGSFYDGRTVFTIPIYFAALGAETDGNYLRMLFDGAHRDDDDSMTRFQLKWSTEGLYVYDGAADQEAGTNIVSTGAWQEYTFDINWMDQTCDVYLDGALVSAQEDISYDLGYTLSGVTSIYIYTDTTAAHTIHIDKFCLGTGFTQDSVPGDLTAGTAVTFSSVKVIRDATELTNKWNGVYQWVAGCRYYDASASEYREVLGKISNETEAQYMDMSSGTTSDYVYIKTIEPATGFGFGMVDGNGNTNAATIDLIEYWDGSQWTTVGDLDDNTYNSSDTASLSQTGSVFWDGSQLSPRKRIFEGDNSPGYWYRVSWSATLSDETYMALVLYATFPEVLPDYDGCVEFKGRLFLWGDPEYPNRMRFSAYDRPDCFSGSDSSYTDPFGDQKKVLMAIKFYNELIVFKEDSVWLLEGYDPVTFGVLKIADTIGLASPKTAHVVEIGFPTMHADEPLSVAIWQDVDGIYVLDGRKPRKVSIPVDQFFNPEYTTCIAATNIRNRQAYIDPLNNEYHFLMPTSELVYNYVTDEFYPAWERNIDLVTGLNLKGTDNRYYTYGGSAAGWVFRLENDTTDKSSANADVAISHYIKTRAIAGIPQQSVSYAFMLRELAVEVKAQSAGSITTQVFKDLASTGVTEAVPSAMSMVNSGYSLAVPELDLSTEDCMCFQVKVSNATADQVIEIWSINYELEVEGDRSQAR